MTREAYAICQKPDCRKVQSAYVGFTQARRRRCMYCSERIQAFAIPLDDQPINYG